MIANNCVCFLPIMLFLNYVRDGSCAITAKLDAIPDPALNMLRTAGRGFEHVHGDVPAADLGHPVRLELLLPFGH